jgi:hypothetical protein
MEFNPVTQAPLGSGSLEHTWNQLRTRTRVICTIYKAGGRRGENQTPSLKRLLECNLDPQVAQNQNRIRLFEKNQFQLRPFFRVYGLCSTCSSSSLVGFFFGGGVVRLASSFFKLTSGSRAHTCCNCHMITQFFSMHVVHWFGPLPNCDHVFHCPDVSPSCYATIPNHELDFFYFGVWQWQLLWFCGVHDHDFFMITLLLVLLLIVMLFMMLFVITLF